MRRQYKTWPALITPRPGMFDCFNPLLWLEIINVVCFAKCEGCKQDPKMLFWIAASIAYAAFVNPNGIKTSLANGSSTFFIKAKSIFNNGLRILLKIILIALFQAMNQARECISWWIIRKSFTKPWNLSISW